MVKRVGVIGIHHESNTFVDGLTTLADFKQHYWLEGDDVVGVFRNAYHELGGMFEALEEEGIVAVPLIYAEALPSGVVSGSVLSTFISRMGVAIDAAGPLDGFLVAPHGAAVSEFFLDMDGHWLTALRNKIGPHVPVVGTLDPHANLSERMVAATDALIAYKTNPHTDQRDVGREAALLIARMLRNEVKPVAHFVELPLAISIEQQHTAVEPCKSLFVYAAELESLVGVLSVSVCIGFPYSDVPEMGTSVLVIEERGTGAGPLVAERLRKFILSDKSRFNGLKKDVVTVISEMDVWETPILFLDMGDNIGGGAPGNLVGLLEAFEQHGKGPFFISIFDPEAVARACAYAPRDRFTLELGLRYKQPGGYRCNVELQWIKNGSFHEQHARHGGYTKFEMGLTALVITDHGNTIMLTSQRVPPFSLQQLLAFDMVPQAFRMIVAKGVNAPLAAYGPVCKTICQVDTEGPTQADMTRFTYIHRKVPLYPFEDS